MNLNPPFSQFKFGLVKEYTLYTIPILATSDKHSIHNSILSLIKNTFNSDNVFVVGHFDGYLGFYMCVENTSSPIYAYCRSNSKEKLTQIADDLTSLYQVLS
jgi:hypothetical protein